MEYRVYQETIKPCKGHHYGKRVITLEKFLESGEVRWDIYKFDVGDNAEKAYQAFVNAARRAPFKGRIRVVKRRGIVSLNRVG